MVFLPAGIDFGPSMAHLSLENVIVMIEAVGVDVTFSAMETVVANG
jgi:hypothetical protein